MNNNVDIGILIKNVMATKGITASHLAKEIATTRTNVYKILRKKNIDTYLLIRISRAIDHNFFKDISEILFGEYEQRS
ncbi:MAG: helix-turn-helix domain-containing protein [Bacteroidales bacterium]|nr:helix-turn-helix domain-containing protein [Bacteroidales bacterium]